MHYPVDVFIGKIRDYDGSRPSAIAKVQIDGELELTERGLLGDEQAEKIDPPPGIEGIAAQQYDHGAATERRQVIDRQKQRQKREQKNSAGEDQRESLRTVIPSI